MHIAEDENDAWKPPKKHLKQKKQPAQQKRKPTLVKGKGELEDSISTDSSESDKEDEVIMEWNDHCDINSKSNKKDSLLEEDAANPITSFAKMCQVLNHVLPLVHSSFTPKFFIAGFDPGKLRPLDSKNWAVHVPVKLLENGEYLLSQFMV